MTLSPPNPRPDNLTGVTWRDYVRAELARASLGRIPLHALVFNGRHTDDGWTITLEFQLTEVDQTEYS
jgi:hypothetical protein